MTMREELMKILAIVEGTMGDIYKQGESHTDNVTIKDLYVHLARKHTSYSIKAIGGELNLNTASTYSAFKRAVNKIHTEQGNFIEILTKCELKLTKDSPSLRNLIMENMKDLQEKDITFAEFISLSEKVISENSEITEITVKRAGKESTIHISKDKELK